MAAALVAILSFGTLLFRMLAEPTVSDIQRFFEPIGVNPATWGQSQQDPHCIESWIESASVKPGSAKFKNWEVSFLNSTCPIYPVPNGGMVFHQYWKGPWRPFIETSIKAFLATQHLGLGHELIFWYEDGEPPADVRASFTNGTSKWRRHVVFREFDRTKEAKDTCMEHMLEWFQLGAGLPHVVNSDLVRSLLLAKYGGVWLNPDLILLRDLTPLIRVGASAPTVSLLLLSINFGL
jgi:hypothetical protein